MALTSISPALSDLAPVESVDPRTGAVVEIVTTETTTAEVTDIVSRTTATGLRYAALPPAARADFLDALASALDGSATELVALAERESALGLARLNGELARTTSQLRLFAEVVREGSFLEITIDHPRPDAVPPAPDLRRMLVPVGPVAVFGASNFPFAFSAAGGDTASTLAAGCAVVVKAHGAHPRLDGEVVRILSQVCAEHGLEGLIGVVFGRRAGTDLVDDPRVQAVGFTGSEQVGRMLMDRAAARPHPIEVYAEMGSLNPLVVCPGALNCPDGSDTPDALEGLATGIAGSVLLGNGQFCTKPGVLFVPAGPGGDALVDRLGTALAEREQRTMLSTAIRDGYRSGVRAVQAVPVAWAVLEDAEPDGPGTAAAALTAVAAADLAGASDSLLVETFGPASLVVRYRDGNELLAAVELVPPSLTLTVHAAPADAEDAALATRLLELGTRRAGRVVFGGYQTGVAVSWAQTHSGPYPAAASLFTSVGATAVRRFQRPVSLQTCPEGLLPEAPREANPIRLPRRVDGVLHPAP